ncbi:hypothetical protein J2T57_000309 [Natronocella acetinitrilica]|uniref:HNH endonuclease n=1 Tax=Natronocella acetinitrilica TaxID=414046 RepID=A0AAE3G0P0_9GAMM|nr:hypothetical protein [Natronocella acetinitrilica]MCP1673217.1 hypothetical protein [Natronocella acetinitrilica]
MTADRSEGNPCALCARSLPLTFHHLIPRKNHRRSSFRRRFDITDMRSRGTWLCHDCHRAIHRLHDERTLGLRLNTLEALQADPAVQRHVSWAARQRRRPS